MTSLYQRLKESGNPKAPMEVICDLIEKGKTAKEIANIMGITERWVRTLMKRKKDGLSAKELLHKKGPRSPHPKRTKPHIEALVIETQQKTNMGPRRLARELKRTLNLNISSYTIRNILRRNNVKTKKVRSRNGNKRYYANLNHWEALQYFQIDSKHIADAKTLPPKAYAALFKYRLPKYQFTAIDIKTRMRILCFSDECSFANGFSFILYIAFLMRALGIRHRMFFQTDNGSEFGGSEESRKRKILQEKFLEPLGVTLLSIPKGEKEAQGFVERSHRTDDEEFYIPALPHITSRKVFMTSAASWVKYYNQKRSHGGRDMNGKTPKEKIFELSLVSSKAATSIPPILLDKVNTFILKMVGAQNISWDSHHLLQLIKRKQFVAPYRNLKFLYSPSIPWTT